MPENETREASKDTLHVMLLGDVVKAYVVTTYKYGKAFSDTITVKKTAFTTPSTPMRCMAV